ncbi:MAG TPA: hypothetical protein H9902_03375 [Candidatus Stackebrandtia faecavium]|nr:hypothetical protein [Candidatus Stackebrandtia faecavium]
MTDTFGVKLKKLKWPIAGATAAVIAISAGAIWISSIPEKSSDSGPLTDYCDSRAADTAADDTIDRPHGAKIETTDSGYSVFEVQVDGKTDTYVSFGATFTNKSESLAHHTDIVFDLKDHNGDSVVTKENASKGWALEQTIPDIAPGDTVGIGGLVKVPDDVGFENDLTMTTHSRDTQWLPDAGSVDGYGLLKTYGLDFAVTQSGSTDRLDSVAATFELYSCEPAPAPGVSFVFRDAEGAIVGGTPAHMVISHNPEHADEVPWRMDTTNQGGFRIPEADLEQSELSAYPEHFDCTTKTLTAKLSEPKGKDFWHCAEPREF